MKMTLLEIVQSVLDSADDDVVNAIDDTEAAESAARVAKEVYFDIVDDEDWPHLNTITRLTSLSDVTQPTVVEIPEDIVLIDYQEVFKYDNTITGGNTTIKDVEYVTPADFMNKVTNLDESASNVTKYTGYNSIPMLIITDKMPEYWTSFDDHYIVMDSFYSAEESTIQGTKCFVQCKQIPTWTESGSFYPDLPHDMFSWYLSKVKTKYHAYHTQKQNFIDAQETQSGKSRQKSKGGKTSGRNKPKSWGRKPAGRVK